MSGEQSVLDAIHEMRVELGERLAKVETRLDEWDKRAAAPVPAPAPAREGTGTGAAAVTGAVSAGVTVGFFEALRRLFS